MQDWEPKKNRLEASDDETKVLETLMSDDGFPKLKDAGGVELLRTSRNCKNLTLINCCCWSVSELKRVVSQQANIYIRPIQNNLSTKPVETYSTQDELLFQSECYKCKKMFKLRELREHTEMCDSPSTSSSDSTMVEHSEQVENGKNDETIIYVFNSNVSNDHESFEVQEMEPVESVNTQSFQSTYTEQQLQGTEEVPDISIDKQPENVIDIVHAVITFCSGEGINDPVEILRKLQKEIVTGRSLDVEDIASCQEGETNFILVDRNNIMRTGFDEIQSLADLRRTLEVQFYGEIASDYGGPRKEFFRLILIEIKEKYFDKGLRELMADEYEVIGTIFALSTLQNGKIPKFLEEDVLKELVSADPPSSACIRNLRKGLDALGMYKALQNIPVLVHLFYKSSVTITFRMLTSLLKPQFSETGSNNRQYEQVVYAAFTRYLREIASGRREGISLGSVLQFVTGADEEPVLGFVLKPCIEFVVCNSFLPTANTCINSLNLPRPSIQQDLPEDEIIFKLYD